MPNWVANLLSVEGKDKDTILKNYLVKDDSLNDYYFDFNKIIPMPPELNIVSGTTTEDAKAIYLSSLNDEDRYKKLLLLKKDWRKDKFEKRLTEPEEKEKVESLLKSHKEKTKYNNLVFKDKQDIIDYGKQAFDNIEKYGNQDWYDWCNFNWGTKWNACNTQYNEQKPDSVYFETAWADVCPLLLEMSKKHPDNVFLYKHAEEWIGNYVGYAIFKNGEIIESENYEDFSKEAYDLAFDLWGCKDMYKYSEEDNTYHFINKEDSSESEM